tara:strand:+ start:1592 stop:1861 length:270 start_codon:yes stop_codon:yes gene_type:complete
MAQLIISIPDEYIPGIEAARNVENNNGRSFSTIEDYSAYVAIEAAKSWCEKYKVGPNWIQPQPEFNSDGTPYVAPGGEDTLVGGEVLGE